MQPVRGRPRHRFLAAAALAAGAVLLEPVRAAPTAEVVHWWTSGGESAAVRQLADAYRAAGGVWIDTAIAGPEQARAVALNRIIGGKPPTAMQFNLSRQFLDVVDQGLLNNVDDLAARENWDRVLPEPVRDMVRIHGHYYAAPVNIHMPTWIWYSKAAFAKAGIASEPRDFDELFAALDKLKAAGLIPLAHGGQGWQDAIVFAAVLSNAGGAELYRKVIAQRDPAAIASEDLRRVLLTFKRLQGYVDNGSPGRNWNDATAMLIAGRAGVQIMGDWAKGEFTLARKLPGRDFACIPGFGARSPYIILGDVFVFPRTADPDTVTAQKLLAQVSTTPANQVAFSLRKGSIPARSDVDASALDACAQTGMAIMKDRSRQLGSFEFFLSPDENGALTDVLTAYWNNNIPVEKVQKDIAEALRN